MVARIIYKETYPVKRSDQLETVASFSLQFVNTANFIKFMILYIDLMRSVRSDRTTEYTQIYVLEDNLEQIKWASMSKRDRAAFEVLMQYFTKFLRECDFKLPERVYSENCIICDEEPESVFISCGHKVLCINCTTEYCKTRGIGLVKCPMCTRIGPICLNELAIAYCLERW